MTIARVWEPVVVTEVEVREVVSGMTVTLAEIAAAEEVDWAEAKSVREA